MTLPVPGAEPGPADGAAVDDAIAQARREVDAGRRLVIYERSTGLLAHWYLALRGDEECERARRYERALTLGVIEPHPGADAKQFSDQTAEQLRQCLRQADLAGYLGNARFVVLMPETDQASAERLLGRLLRGPHGSQAGVSVFPRDGMTFSSLYAVAVRRLARGSAIQARRYRRIDQAA